MMGSHALYACHSQPDLTGINVGRIWGRCTLKQGVSAVRVGVRLSDVRLDGPVQGRRRRWEAGAAPCALCRGASLTQAPLAGCGPGGERRQGSPSPAVRVHDEAGSGFSLVVSSGKQAAPLPKSLPRNGPGLAENMLRRVCFCKPALPPAIVITSYPRLGTGVQCRIAAYQAQLSLP